MFAYDLFVKISNDRFKLIKVLYSALNQVMLMIIFEINIDLSAK